MVDIRSPNLGILISLMLHLMLIFLTSRNTWAWSLECMSKLILDPVELLESVENVNVCAVPYSTSGGVLELQYCNLMVSIIMINKAGLSDLLVELVTSLYSGSFCHTSSLK